MFKFNLYNLENFDLLENLFLLGDNSDVVFLCLGTKKYFNDSFGVLMGDELKNIKVISFGSSKREVNGTNFLKVYDFIRQKYKNSKIVLIDSVFSGEKNSPILIYQNYGTIPAGICNNKRIGDESILFNSFSYIKKDIIEKVVKMLTNMIKKCVKN